MSVLYTPPRRKISFMLTPLVDVMFLLLIFFMLSSQTSPYALLQLLASSTESDVSAEPPPPQANPVARNEVVVSIARGYARLNGERVEMAALPAAIARFQQAGFASAVVLSSQAATVQDVVWVLEAFETSGFPDVQLVMQAAAP